MRRSYAQEIIRSLNALLQSGGYPTLGEEDALFVMDEEVDYGTEWKVGASELVGARQLGELLAPVLSGGCSWIHAHLIRTREGRPVVTLRFGAPIGNASPSLNVSHEVNDVIKVVN